MVNLLSAKPQIVVKENDSDFSLVTTVLLNQHLDHEAFDENGF